jgi:glycosyltransferase involved in cell wall biosynthesis
MMERWGVRKPIQVITNGVICSNPYSGQKEYDVVTVSRLTNWKNIDLVINACSEIGLSLAIVGDGPELSQLKKLAATANASTKFFGELDQEGVSQVLRESCIYILFSNYEGLSFSLLEAMMFGKPVIVSDVPGNRDVIEHGVTGLVVPVNSHQKLVDALRYLAEHPELANSLGNKAHEVAKNKFCIENNLDQINSLLTEKSK